MTTIDTTRPPEARLYLDDDEIVVDSFAGGGGASKGIEIALGRGPDIAINHDAEAIALHAANHPDSEHYTEDVWHVDPVAACRGRRVGIMWLSPDCKHFSKAKGGKPVSPRVRGLAWVAIRWAKAVKPRIIVLENVEEFQTWGPIDKVTQRPDPTRRGRTFKMFVGRLRGLGYVVEWKELRGCDYGAPTIRKRLFLIARSDGQPIVWPKPTHGKGRAQAWRTAAECIDFELRCPSIFERAKPLAPNTLKRIGAGLRKFVFESDRPFIVGVGGRMGQSPPRSVAQPYQTITTKADAAIVVPHVVPVTHDGGPARVYDVQAPLPTITAAPRGEMALVEPYLVQYHSPKRAGDDRTADLAQPLPTQDVSNRFGYVAPVLVPRYGEDPDRNAGEGQPPRCRSVENPMPTIVPTSNGAQLVAGFLAKHYGGHMTPGTQLELPISTLTTQDHHHLVEARLEDLAVTSSLLQFNRNCDGRSIDDPLPTITAQGEKFAEVRAFLVAYYGSERDGASLFDPMRTLTAKERFGLVTVGGVDYQLVDIGMRMLAPRELYRAQGFPDTYKIDIMFRGKPMSKTAQVRMCGNSVCPDVAAAIIRANVGKRAAVERIA